MSYEKDRILDTLCLFVARHLPKRLRKWVVVDSTNVARSLYPTADGYVGPDGLEYKHIYDGARRER